MHCKLVWDILGGSSKIPMHNGFNWVPLGRPLLEPNIALKWAYFNMGHPRIPLYSYYIILIFVLIVELVDRF